MRRYIYLLIAVVSAVVLFSCQKPYEEQYDTLRVDHKSLTVGKAAGSTPIMVYYSGAWSASLSDDCDWAELDVYSGTGISTIHFIRQENTVSARTTNIVLTMEKGGEPVTIKITQNK